MFRTPIRSFLAFARPSHLLTRNLKPRVAPRLQFPKFRRFQSTQPLKEPKGIKALVKEYGYSALGVYLFLSALDLPLCYALVHLLGKEEIEKYENSIKQYFGYGKSDQELEKIQEINRIHDEDQPEETSFLPWFSWTEFAIAYGIHKSVFIFVRVPLTAALTPGIVKILRGWGFKIGTDKLATTAAIAKDNISHARDIATASSARFGTKVSKKNKWFSWFF